MMARNSIPTKTVYSAWWRLRSTKANWQDQFEATCSLADQYGLDLIDITDGGQVSADQMLGDYFDAHLVGDLHAVFAFTARMDSKPYAMQQFEVVLQ